MPAYPERLRADEKLIRADLLAYARRLRATTEQEYGPAVAASVEQFLSILLKQDVLPGLLVTAGYRLAGGRDRSMILRAARAVAMLHAVVTAQRAAHPALRLAAQAGEHAAQILLANLEVDAEINRRAVSIAQRTLLLATHAETLQKSNPAAPQILEWQSLECAVNPLHIGMVLADADCAATDAITPFATALGKGLADPKNALAHFAAARKHLRTLPHRWPAEAVELLGLLADRQEPVRVYNTSQA